MEGIIILPILVALYFVFKTNTSKEDSKKGIIKIDDKHFIINNEYVSLDYNDECHIMKQEMEDSKVFRSYAMHKRLQDYAAISQEYMNTISHYNYKEGIGDIKPNELIANKEKYKYYLKKCRILGEQFRLNEKEFTYKEKTFGCWYLGFKLWYYADGYTIHSPDNAKYSKNMMDTLAKEFKEKYY